MANSLLQSSQNKETTAPEYYNTYLSNLATQGKTAADQAQFVGAQPLQTQAFGAVANNFGAQQPNITAGQNFVCQAASQDVTGAASPYLCAATGSSPLSAMQPYAQSAMATTGAQTATPLINKGANVSGLCAANPYLQQATGTSPADMAQQYMNPYLNTAVKSMSDIAQRNIQNNLSPQATAAAVGSGQYGSRRNAQVLGQVQENAMQDLNSQIAQMMASGYGQALCAAGKQNALTAQAGSTAGTLANQTAQNQITAGTNLGTLQQGANTIAAGLGSTAATAQNAQNQVNLGAANTASQAATNEGQLLNTAGQNMGTLAQTGAAMNLACINALSTLGGQQQTIGQNAQNYDLSKLSSLGSLLQGYSVPTGTKTTLCMSPLSGLGAVAGVAGGIAKCFPGITGSITNGIKDLFGAFGGSGGGAGGGTEPCACCDTCSIGGMKVANGGLIKGCVSTASHGGLPTKKG